MQQASGTHITRIHHTRIADTLFAFTVAVNDHVTTPHYIITTRNAAEPGTKSYMDMASTLFTFTFTCFLNRVRVVCSALAALRPACLATRAAGNFACVFGAHCHRLDLWQDSGRY